MLSDQCLGEDTVKGVVYMVHFIYEPTQANFVFATVAGARTYQLFFDHCKIERYLLDPTAFCFSHDCDMYAIVNNVYKNLYWLTADLGHIQAVLFSGISGEPTTVEGLQEHYGKVGKSLGSLVGRVLNFRGRRFNI